MHWQNIINTITVVNSDCGLEIFENNVISFLFGCKVTDVLCEGTVASLGVTTQFFYQF